MTGHVIAAGSHDLFKPVGSSQVTWKASKQANTQEAGGLPAFNESRES